LLVQDYRLKIETLKDSGNRLLRLFVVAVDDEYTPADSLHRSRTAGARLAHNLFVHQTNQVLQPRDGLSNASHGVRVRGGGRTSRETVDDDRRKHAAFYLADDRKTLMLVRATELSIGFPTVRSEVTSAHSVKRRSSAG